MVYSEARFMSLCQQASVEQDPNKLLHLVNEISAMLDAKRKQTTGQTQRPWREIAKEVCHEQDSEKFVELTCELCDALNEQVSSERTA